MANKKKYNEQSRIMSLRVPESQHDWLKEKIATYIKRLLKQKGIKTN